MTRLTKKQKYEKELKEIESKYANLLAHHISSVFLRFANDIFKLNNKFFEFKELKNDK